jgi:hypothetical protein
LIQKEDRSRKREAGNEETSKRGRASRYLFPGRAWEQAGRAWEQAGRAWEQAGRAWKGNKGTVRAPSGLCLIRSDFNRLGNEAILLIFPAVGHCGAGHTCSIDTSAIYISIAEVGIGKIGIPQIGKSQVCTV